MNIHDKTIALVTGANKGLGFEISRQLAQKEIGVLLAARDPNKGAETTEKLQSQGLDVQFIQLDVTDSASITLAEQEIRDRFGKLDILVNNAGILLDWGVQPSELDRRSRVLIPLSWFSYQFKWYSGQIQHRG